DQGIFEGLSYPELMHCEKDFLKRWLADPAAVRMPGGESLVELQERTWPAVAEIVRRGINALVVSHNFTLASILCRIMGLALSEFRKVSVDTASRTIVRFQEGKGIIVTLNDRRHLEGGD
ncbi:MAG: histidine phosphatase family protein, partial [Syntrophales bacterium]|nr:histidine phosphatase family protein [Syntrophales bacterium]